MNKNLIIQYSVRHTQEFDCNGAAIKLFPSTLEQKTLSSETPFNISFGPDICAGKQLIKSSLRYKNNTYELNKSIPFEADNLTHVYTLLLDGESQTYFILVDNKIAQAGLIEEDWDMLPPKQIPDPTMKKPFEWVDDMVIADPSDKKPANWTDEPREIIDMSAEKPEEWDDELDGEWERPNRLNPNYRGIWAPRMIPNPAYKGPWIAPLVENPDYVYDSSIGQYDDNAFVGLQFFQHSSGSIFDNILVTDDTLFAASEAKKIIKKHRNEQSVMDEYFKGLKERVEYLRNLDYDHEEFYDAPSPYTAEKKETNEAVVEELQNGSQDNAVFHDEL